MDKDPAVTLTGRATADPARDGPLVPDLVTGARTGDKRAWDALVERYAPMIWSICWKYRLGHADAQDVGQSVWLCLVDQLDKIRDPAALPGWLAVTTRRECGRVLGTARRLRAPVYPLDIENLPVPHAEISARLEIPVGSIGPKRSRYLDKLRRDPAISALINAAHGRRGA
jgi:DNA-directed RNA polymerase specialized sigma24 family protein